MPRKFNILRLELIKLKVPIRNTKNECAMQLNYQGILVLILAVYHNKLLEIADHAHLLRYNR